jgi:hypothetical protein
LAGCGDIVDLLLSLPEQLVSWLWRVSRLALQLPPVNCQLMVSLLPMAIFYVKKEFLKEHLRLFTVFSDSRH